VLALAGMPAQLGFATLQVDYEGRDRATAGRNSRGSRFGPGSASGDLLVRLQDAQLAAQLLWVILTCDRVETCLYKEPIPHVMLGPGRSRLAELLIVGR
jgi:hypothetical protein